MPSLWKKQSHPEVYAGVICSKYSLDTNYCITRNTIIDSPTEVTEDHSDSKSRKIEIRNVNENIEVISKKLELLQEDFNIEDFNEYVNEFLTIMKNANDLLPRPIHTGKKYYLMRKNKVVLKKQKSTLTQETNPELRDKRKAQNRMDKCNYELTQYWFFQQKKKNASTKYLILMRTSNAISILMIFTKVSPRDRVFLIT